MKTFCEFIDNAKQKYIYAKCNQQTQDNLRKYCLSNGLDLSTKYDKTFQHPSEFVFHTTIIYSSSLHDIINLKFVDLNYQSTPVGFEMFGLEKNVPVLKLQSPDLEHLHQILKQHYKFEETWPEFKPHVTLSYNGSNLNDLNKLKLPDFPIVYDEIIIEDVQSPT